MRFGSVKNVEEFVRLYFKECYIYGITDARSFTIYNAKNFSLSEEQAKYILDCMPKDVPKTIVKRIGELLDSYASHYTRRYLVRGLDSHKLTEYQ